jgi:hypothetical protein
MMGPTHDNYHGSTGGGDCEKNITAGNDGAIRGKCDEIIRGKSDVVIRGISDDLICSKSDGIALSISDEGVDDIAIVTPKIADKIYSELALTKDELAMVQAKLDETTNELNANKCALDAMTLALKETLTKAGVELKESKQGASNANRDEPANGRPGLFEWIQEWYKNDPKLSGPDAGNDIAAEDYSESDAGKNKAAEDCSESDAGENKVTEDCGESDKGCSKNDCGDSDESCDEQERIEDIKKLYGRNDVAHDEISDDERYWFHPTNGVGVDEQLLREHPMCTNLIEAATLCKSLQSVETADIRYTKQWSDCKTKESLIRLCRPSDNRVGKLTWSAAQLLNIWSYHKTGLTLESFGDGEYIFRVKHFESSNVKTKELENGDMDYTINQTTTQFERSGNTVVQAIVKMVESISMSEEYKKVMFEKNPQEVPICTDRMKVKNLLNLGLDPATADMCSQCTTNMSGEHHVIESMLMPCSYQFDDKLMPAWSLAALLGLFDNYLQMKLETTWNRGYWLLLVFEYPGIVDRKMPPFVGTNFYWNPKTKEMTLVMQGKTAVKAVADAVTLVLGIPQYRDILLAKCYTGKSKKARR